MGLGTGTPIDGRKDVAVAGTREALSATAQRVHLVDITAQTENTGRVTVGGPTVVAAEATRRGTPLDPGATQTLMDVDLSQVYVDALVNGEGVTWCAVAK